MPSRNTFRSWQPNQPCLESRNKFLRMRDWLNYWALTATATYVQPIYWNLRVSIRIYTRTFRFHNANIYVLRFLLKAVHMPKWRNPWLNKPDDDYMEYNVKSMSVPCRLHHLQHLPNKSYFQCDASNLLVPTKFIKESEQRDTPILGGCWKLLSMSTQHHCTERSLPNTHCVGPNQL